MHDNELKLLQCIPSHTQHIQHMHIEAIITKNHFSFLYTPVRVSIIYYLYENECRSYVKMNMIHKINTSTHSCSIDAYMVIQYMRGNIYPHANLALILKTFYSLMLTHIITSAWVFLILSTAQPLTTKVLMFQGMILFP